MPHHVGIPQRQVHLRHRFWGKKGLGRRFLAIGLACAPRHLPRQANGKLLQFVTIGVRNVILGMGIDTYQMQRSGRQPRLFQQFPARAGFYILAPFHHPTGQPPEAKIGAALEEDTAVFISQHHRTKHQKILRRPTRFLNHSM